MILQKTFPLACANYSKVFNVEIRMQGSKAFTDGTRIVIPRLSLKNRKSQNMAFGYLSHEAGHIRYTDFHFMKKVNIQSSYIFHIFNLLEDTRIERLMGLEFIGVWENLEKLRCLVTCTLDDIDDLYATHDTFSMLLFYLAISSYFYGNQYRSFKQHLYKLRNLLMQKESSLTDDILNHLDTVVKEASVAKNSKEVLQITLKLVIYLDRLNLSYNKSTQKNNNADKELDKLLKSTEKDFDKKDVEEINKILDKMTKIISKKAAITKDNFSSYLLSRNINDTLEKKFCSFDLNAMIEGLYEEGSTSRDDFGQVLHERCQKGRDDFLDLVLKNHVNLENKIRRYTLSFKEKLVSESRIGKKINVKKIPFLKTGESRVFLREASIVDYNTCVHLLVDSSGSMDACDNNFYKRISVACQCSLATALALDGVDFLECAVSYFPGQNAEVSLAKDYMERARVKAPYFDQKPRGSTPLAQAIWHAISLMSTRERARNIIIIITDGFPDSKKKVRDVLDFCHENNIEVYGIGINTDGISRLLDKFIIIKDLRDLDKSIYDLFTNILEKSFYQKN